MHKITEKARLHSLESQEKVFSSLELPKLGSIATSFYMCVCVCVCFFFFSSEIASFIQEQEVVNLQKKLNEFIEERRGWATVTSKLLNV